MAQCQAKLCDGSRRCRAQATTGKRVCRKHGANGGMPPRSGRWSQKPRPMALLQQAATPDLLEIGRHIVVHEGYLRDLVGRLEENDSPNLRTRVLRLLEDEDPKVDEAIELLKQGVAWDSTWKKVIEVSGLEAGLVARHQELRLRGEVSLPAARVMLLFQQFIRIVRDVTGSPALTRRILSKTYREVLGAEPRIALLAPEGQNAAETTVSSGDGGDLEANPALPG